MSVARIVNLRPQYVDANGNPYVGARLFSYQSGTSTKLSTFTDSTGNVANSNPRTLDANGFLGTETWGTIGATYKLLLAPPGADDPPGVSIWTEDNVAPIPTSSLVVSEWTAGDVPSYISATSFSVPGDQRTAYHAGRRIRFNASGIGYATIKSASFGSGLTTVVIDVGGLNANLSAVDLSILSASPGTQSLPCDNLATITGDTTLQAASDFPTLKKVTAAATITLPAASTVAPGRPVTIKSRTEAAVLLALTGGDTLEGVAAGRAIASYDCWIIESDGASDWMVVRRGQWNVGDIKYSSDNPSEPGWLTTDGAAVSRTTYGGLAAKYAALSYPYGAGDGATTFNLPDHRGRMPIATGTGTVVEIAAASAVDAGANTITVTSNLRKWVTGMAVVPTSSGGLPDPLVSGNTYYVIRVGAAGTASTAIKIASSLANAQAETGIDLTTQGTGNHTLTHTYDTRGLAERGGQTDHAMDINELLRHRHVAVQGSGASTGAGGNTQSGFSDFEGGNKAMNVMNPFIALSAWVKT